MTEGAKCAEGVLVTYRLIAPGSEWRLHRQRFDSSAMADLLKSDFGLAEKNTLYRCLDRLVEHKDDLFKSLKRRWGELFGATFEVHFSIAKATANATTAKTASASLAFKLDRDKLRQVRRREGRYLLRTNLTAGEPTRLWKFYIQLTEVEQAFKELKHDLSIRPIDHQLEHRIEAHIFVAFLAYCLQVTLKANLRRLAGGTTPREVIDKFAAMQMVDVLLPTTDGREPTLSR